MGKWLYNFGRSAGDAIARTITDLCVGAKYRRCDYRGGHEYYINECNTSLRFLGFVNSWGEKFGLGGKFYMTFETYAELLRQNGDACTAPELPLLPEPVPSNPGCNPMEKARNIWRAIRE